MAKSSKRSRKKKEKAKMKKRGMEVTKSLEDEKPVDKVNKTETEIAENGLETTEYSDVGIISTCKMSEDEKWGTEVSIKIISMLCTIILSVFGAQIAHNQYMLTKLTQPLIHEVLYEEFDTIYEITLKDGEVIETGAPAANVFVRSGSLKSLTVITYDKNGFRILRQETLFNEPSVCIEVEQSKHGLIATVTDTDSETTTDYNWIYYDYYFLYIKSIAGEGELLLVCTEVNIDKETAEMYTYNSAYLLELKLNTRINDAQKQMLEAYQELMTNLADINQLAKKL